ncbi:MAG: ribbon-helix-helix domain-containing protein [Aeromonas sp.]
MSIKPPPKRAAAIVIDTAPVKPLTVKDESSLTPINFKVSPEFRRTLKMYAAETDQSMTDIVVRAVNELIQREGK